ncbi:MAG: hypothetical protein U9R19_14510 [Bacteroidota bacterium]|nr:hypothetical protein [Bacteroidota bacterium]
MKKINWLKISGIVAVVTLVLISLFSFTAFLRRLPEINEAFTFSICLTFLGTVATIFYVSKTHYGSDHQKENTDNK